MHKPAPGVAHLAPRDRQRRDAVAVLRTRGGPGGEHLPGADGVDLLDIGRHDNADVVDLGIHEVNDARPGGRLPDGRRRWRGIERLSPGRVLSGDTLTRFGAPGRLRSRRCLGCSGLADIDGVAVRVHWTDHPCCWHINGGVFVVLDGAIEVHDRDRDEEPVERLTLGSPPVGRAERRKATATWVSGFGGSDPPRQAQRQRDAPWRPGSQTRREARCRAGRRECWYHDRRVRTAAVELNSSVNFSLFASQSTVPTAER